jgi:hypothetical protein
MLVRARFARDIIKQFRTFYPWVIQGDQTAQDIALAYYGDKSYDWLVYFSNDYFDPYTCWPMTYDEMQKFVTNKYGGIVEAQNTTLFYEYDATVDPSDVEAIYRSGYQMDPSTYSFLSVDDKSFWKPVDALTYETRLNDQKRSIQLLDNDLKQPVETELKAKLNNGV